MLIKIYIYLASIIITLSPYIYRAHILPPHLSQTPAKQQTHASRLLREVSQRSRREQEREVQKSYSKAVKEKDRESNRFSATRAVCGDNDSLVQLFVRREDCGPFSLFDETVVTDQRFDILVDCDGGIVAEEVRSNLDQWACSFVFGAASPKGLGAVIPSPSVLEKVKKQVPQLKSIKPRLLQFAYKLLQEQSVTLLDKSQLISSSSLGRSRLSDLPVIAPINISQLLTSNNENNPNYEKCSWEHTIDKFTAHLIESNVSEVLICCDGSASLSGDASAGLAVIPILKDIQPRKEEEGDKNDDVKRDDNYPLEELASRSLLLRVTDVGGMVSTPFDAELVAGLSAISLAVSMARCDPNRSLDLLVLSDSRSLCKVSRTTSGGEIDEEERNSTSTNNNTSNRRQLEQLLQRLASLLSDRQKQQQQREKTFKVEWTQGHPERRESDMSLWTISDSAIWMADELAKSRYNSIPDSDQYRRLFGHTIFVSAIDLVAWSDRLYRTTTDKSI